MNKITVGAFLIVQLILSSKGLSQPFVDLLNIRFQYFPPVSYSSKAAKMDIREMTYGLTLPFQFKNKNAIITGISYDQLRFGYSDTSENKNLYGVNLLVGYLHYLKVDKWKVLIMALPKLSSDHLFHHAKEYQQGGVVLFTYKRKANLAYRLGLYYNSEFFGHFFMPLLGLEWKPFERVYFYGVFPNNLNLEYKARNKLYLGLSYSNLTQSYRIQENDSYIRNGDRF